MIKYKCILFIYFTLIHSGLVWCSTSYHVGNSLTWDMQPSGLAAMATSTNKSHQVGYHIRSGMHLDYIWRNPDDVEVITNSFGTFENALPSNDWGIVTIQPYYRTGSTLGQDQAAISNFIDLTLSGPSTKPAFYIYSAWPSLTDEYQAYWSQIVSNKPDQQTIHTRDYFSHLHQNLLNQYGEDFQLYLIPIGEVFYRLDQAFKEDNNLGYENVTDLYRDVSHLTKDIGRFVAVTTVYSTIFKESPEGIERPAEYYLDDAGVSGLTLDMRNLIQSVVWDVVSRHPLSGVDVNPDEFTLGSVMGSELSTMHYSHQISVLGLNAASDISITGGEYSINGGQFTSDRGFVSNDDLVVVRLLSSSMYSIEVAAVLTIGGLGEVFSVTTLDEPVFLIFSQPGNTDTSIGSICEVFFLLLLSIVSIGRVLNTRIIL